MEWDIHFSQPVLPAVEKPVPCCDFLLVPSSSVGKSGTLGSAQKPLGALRQTAFLEAFCRFCVLVHAAEGAEGGSGRRENVFLIF